MGPRLRRARRAYLLAAGRGERAGGPKAWLEFDGKSLLRRQLDFLTGLFDPREVAVSIQPGWLGRCRALHQEVLWVPVDSRTSPLASLQALLTRAPPDAWAFVYHVDMPLWKPGLFKGMEAAIPLARRAAAVVPVHGGRRGHPALLSPAAMSLLSALNPARDRLDHWLRGAEVHEVEAAAPCIHANWNLSSDLPTHGPGRRGRPAG